MYEGNIILHTHDWMAGGVVNAYAKARGIKVLHTFHNTFTNNLPVELLRGINLGEIKYYMEI